MTAFLGEWTLTQMQFTVCRGKNCEDLQDFDTRSWRAADEEWLDLWPSGGLLNPNAGVGFSAGPTRRWSYRGVLDGGFGHKRRKVIAGIAYSSPGVPAAGATVMLFNTATGLLVDQTVTDANGAYALGDPNAVNCFVVASLGGATQGVTVNNLAGS